MMNLFFVVLLFIFGLYLFIYGLSGFYKLLINFNPYEVYSIPSIYSKVLPKQGKYHIYIQIENGNMWMLNYTFFKSFNIAILINGIKTNGGDISFFTMNQGKSAGGKSYTRLKSFSTTAPNQQIEIHTTSTYLQNARMIIKEDNDKQRLLAICSTVVGFMICLAALST